MCSKGAQPDKHHAFLGSALFDIFSICKLSDYMYNVCNFKQRK